MFNVDLDLPPKQRWTEVATQYKPQILDLIQTIVNLVTPVIPNARELVDSLCGDLENRLPQPYRDEITGIAEAVDLPVGEIVLYNIFYEIFTVCTSIIAVDPSGTMYHARNLDFGLFLGWNYTVHEWPISQHLRNMIINVNWIQGGKVVFKSNNFAGFVGVYNGLRQNGFTLTANERFQKAGGYVGIYRWLMGLEPNGKFMTWLAREAMLNATTYAEAKKILSEQDMLSPVYWILGGVNAYDGCIIARSLQSVALITEMNPQDSKKGWYLLETNYDQNATVLYLDDRRTPGNACMQMLGRKNVGFQGIYNVLSSRTVLNKLTTYSVLMKVSTGQFETHLQSCPGECWAW